MTLSCGDFIIVDSFILLDTNCDNNVSTEELKTFFESNKISASDEEIQMLVRRFSKENNGCMKYSEYGSVFISKKDRFKM